MVHLLTVRDAHRSVAGEVLSDAETVAGTYTEEATDCRDCITALAGARAYDRVRAPLADESPAARYARQYATCVHVVEEAMAEARKLVEQADRAVRLAARIQRTAALHGFPVGADAPAPTGTPAAFLADLRTFAERQHAAVAIEQ